MLRKFIQGLINIPSKIDLVNDCNQLMYENQGLMDQNTDLMQETQELRDEVFKLKHNNYVLLEVNNELLFKLHENSSKDAINTEKVDNLTEQYSSEQKLFDSLS